jgi:hypothetical protein
MKKGLALIILLIIAFSLTAEWIVGEPILDDYSWTDSNGEFHSIFELTSSCKAVVLFWGTTG